MSPRTRFIVSRLLQLVLTLWIVATLAFLLLRLAPGDPTDRMVDPSMPPSVRISLRHQFGLDRPVLVQYWLFLKNLLHGNLGRSFFSQQTVVDAIGPGIENTMILGLVSMLIAYPIAIIGGAWMASRRGRVGESVALVVVTVLRAAPLFWMAMLAIFVFAFHLSWFPLSGSVSIGSANRGQLDTYFSLDFLHHLALPALVVAAHLVALPLLLTRSAMQNVLDEDYIDLARAKGLSKRRVLYRHALRNALLPVTTDAAAAIGSTVGSLIAVETVFSWPGVGRDMVLALREKDYPVAQGCFLVICAMVSVLNLLADILYGFIDPRITYARSKAVAET